MQNLNTPQEKKQETAKPEEKKDSRKPLLILPWTITAISFIGLGIGGYWIFSKEINKTDPHKQTCTYDEKTYNDGDEFNATDICNKCLCNNGKVICTQLECDETNKYFISVNKGIHETIVDNPELTFRNESDRELKEQTCGNSEILLYYNDIDPSGEKGFVTLSYLIYFHTKETNNYYQIYTSEVYDTQNSQEFNMFWNDDCSKVVITGSFHDIQNNFSSYNDYKLLYFDTNQPYPLFIRISEEEYLENQINDIIISDEDRIRVNFTNGTEREIKFPKER